jgi:putative FmdB family regulatory protein
MPLFEYDCHECGNKFELLVRGTMTPECPRCHSQDLERILSLFSVNSESTRQVTLQSARRKNASLRKEKAIADQEAIHHHDD